MFGRRSQLEVVILLMTAFIISCCCDATERVKVAVAEAPPETFEYAYRDTKTGEIFADGIAVRIWKAAAEAYNISYEWVLDSSGTYGAFNKTTGEWSGVVGLLVNGQADLSLTALTITKERLSAVDFTTSIYRDTTTLILPVSAGMSRSATNILYLIKTPFSAEVWGSVLGFLILGAIVLHATRSVAIFADKTRRDAVKSRHPQDVQKDEEVEATESSVVGDVWRTYCYLLHQAEEDPPSLSPTRLLVSSYWLFGIVITSMYTARLVALLAVPGQLTFPVDTAEALADDTQLKIIVERGSFLLDSFKTSEYPAYSKLGSRSDEFIQQNFKDSLPLLEDSRHVFLASPYTARGVALQRYMKTRTCPFIVGKHTFIDQWIAMAIRKGSPLLSKLNNLILHLHTRGVIQQWVTASTTTVRLCDQDQADTAQNKLTLADTEGFFYLWLGGLGLATTAFLLETLLHHFTTD